MIDVITRQLEALTKLAGVGRGIVVTQELAQKLAERRGRHETMNLIIDELWRRYKYVADPMNDESFGLPRPGDSTVDVDGACLFVVALAQGFGIRCRFVMARYSRAAWTLFVAYETEDGSWQSLNVLRQKTDQVPNELVMGPIPGSET
jgi:hypothetical protein